MKRQDLVHTVTSLQSKVEKLVHLHKKLAEENHRLTGETDSLRKEKESLKIKLKSLEEKLQVRNLAAATGVNSTDKSELKSKINELVREIDKCIALLNR
ncbi:MAG: hypothetical protein IT233_04665 [Bacteroidia bacterium]|nr:hypothetical protein [Bacteroidia bacterium]